MPFASPLAGFASVAALKAAALPAIPANNPDFDPRLQAIGNNIARVFEIFARRKFVRVEADQFVFNGDVATAILPRYPIESVSLYEYYSYGNSDAEGNPIWTQYTDQAITTTDTDAGIIYFGYPWGTSLDRVRVTFTGGYWIDPGPDDQGNASVAPPNALPMPDELLYAWQLQCAAAFESQDILGVGVVRDEKTPASADTAGAGLLPIVREILGPYRKLG